MARTKSGKDAAKKNGKKKIVDPIEAEYLSADDDQFSHEDESPQADATDRKALRSLSQMAADGQDSSVGIACPRCNCQHLRVVSTWDIDGGRRRKRLCRHCGYEFATTEK